MKVLLKKTRAFWICDIIIMVLLALYHLADRNPDRGVLLAWAIFIAKPIEIFEMYIAGPLFAIIVQKNKLTSKELLWSTVLIFTMTFIAFYIPFMTFNDWQEVIFPLTVAFIVSTTYCITNIICNIIRKRIRR